MLPEGRKQFSFPPYRSVDPRIAFFVYNGTYTHALCSLSSHMYIASLRPISHPSSHTPDPAFPRALFFAVRLLFTNDCERIDTLLIISYKSSSWDNGKLAS
jgi:hypothetical protein